MGVSRSTTVQIQGKTFGLSFEKVGNGGSVHVREAVRKRTHRLVYLRLWLDGCSMPWNLRSDDRRDLRTNKVWKVLGFIRSRSNFRGCYLELGFSSCGKCRPFVLWTLAGNNFGRC